MKKRSFSWCSTGSFHFPTQNILIVQWPNEKRKKAQWQLHCLCVSGKKNGICHSLHPSQYHFIIRGNTEGTPGRFEAVSYASHKRCRKGWPPKNQAQQVILGCVFKLSVWKSVGKRPHSRYLYSIHTHMHTNFTHISVLATRSAGQRPPEAKFHPSNSGGSPEPRGKQRTGGHMLPIKHFVQNSLLTKVILKYRYFIYLFQCFWSQFKYLIIMYFFLLWSGPPTHLFICSCSSPLEPSVAYQSKCLSTTAWSSVCL